MHSPLWFYLTTGKGILARINSHKSTEEKHLSFFLLTVLEILISMKSAFLRRCISVVGWFVGNFLGRAGLSYHRFI